MKTRILFFSFLLISFSAHAQTLSGVVSLQGDIPAQQELNMKADSNCAAHYGDEDVYNPQVLVDDSRHLKNVFVYLKSGVQPQNFEKPAEKVVLDQKGCLFEPRVFGLRTGQALEMTNSDETLHNVHAQPEKQKRFNIGLPMQGMKMSRSFDKEEVMVTIKCDVHPWMRAYAGVLDHPFFAVTDEHGYFAINDIPPGIYEVEIWHELFGRQTREVILQDETQTADFVFQTDAV